MKHLLTQIPIPMSGLMLALFSLTKLTQTVEQPGLSLLFFGLGIILWLMLTAKIFFAWDSVKHDLQNPIIASVAPTYTMGTMVLASLFVEAIPYALLLWGAAFIVQVVIVGYFIKQFLWHQELELSAVYPSWFILFVGLGIVPVTAGAILPALSSLIFWLAFASYILLVPIVVTRLYKMRLQDAVKPLVTILAAPGSLCFVGYIQTFGELNSHFMTGLFVVSQLLYIVALIHVPKLITNTFYPSFAAFTFPLVISATAAVSMAQFVHYPMFYALAVIECLIAVSVVLYVFARYSVFLKNLVRAQVK